MAQLIFETIDLEDVVVNDKTKYNSNNHWDIRPVDYDEVLSKSNASHWIDHFKTYHKITIDPKELSWMRECNKISEQTAKFSHQFDDELNALVTSLNTLYGHLFNGTPYFVRCDTVSLKYGQHGVGPYYNIKDIIESAVSSRKGHSPLRESTTLNFYLIKWININPDKEFRIFVHNNNITCISQQNCYRSNALNSEIVKHCCEIMINYWQNVVKGKITHINNYTIDMAVLEDDTPYFIEINSFGKEYAAGSALFHWIIDKKKLCNDKDNIVYVRIAV